MEQIDLNKDIDAAVHVLDEGGVILYPTDTVWGIGCDACNPAAVEKVYRIKNRPDSKALITLVGSVGDLHRWVEDVPPVAGEMIAASERPVTVVFDKGRGLALNLLAADGSQHILDESAAAEQTFGVKHAHWLLILCARV